MAFRFMLLALALCGAVSAEYDYTRSSSNNQKVTSEINSLEQQDSSSIEEYRSNYQTPQTNDHNSEATPKGYDYSGQASDSDAALQQLGVRNSQSVNSAGLFQSQVPVSTFRAEPEVFPPASYSFNYAVNDESTGDIKDHSETRDGYVVRGSYSLIDPDGYKRTVTYTADDIHGFNAIVNRVPYVLKKLAVVSPQSVVLDERSPVSLVSAVSAGSAAGAAGSAAVKNADNTLSALNEDSYVSAARDRDTNGGIYA